MHVPPSLGFEFCASSGKVGAAQSLVKEGISDSLMLFGVVTTIVFDTEKIFTSIWVLVHPLDVD